MKLRHMLWTLLMVVTALGCYDRSPRAADSEGTGAPVQSERTPGEQVDEAADFGELAADGGIPVDAGLTCEKRASVAALRVEFTCRSVTVYTCKDLSNLVIEFEDGTRQRFEGQSGHVNDFSGTGANAGKRIVRVWVKAGANHSGEGPGYGQRVETTVTECPPPPGAGSGGAGGCVAGPDVPCGELPSGGVGGNAGSGGTGGSDDGEPSGPE
jgi:hypothetical protein